ncbi:hypothetical protein ACFL52_01140 [Candidatus Margulisiibacteriota bacterium]
MHKKKPISYLDRLEAALKKLWRKHHKAPVIKARHTEIQIEPHPFVRGHINPQMAEFLIGLYLKKVHQNNIYNDQIIVKDGVLMIKDQNGKLIAETSSPKLVKEYLN